MPMGAQADVLVCDFTPTNCPPGASCDAFMVTIDTHHALEAPLFDFGGHLVPIVQVPEGAVEAPTYVTLGHADREFITLFNGFDAIHTRHYTTTDHAPTAQTSVGQCVSFW